MYTKATIALLLALGLTSGALAANPEPAPVPHPLVTVPTYTGPDAPMRSWNDYAKRWE